MLGNFLYPVNRPSVEGGTGEREKWEGLLTNFVKKNLWDRRPKVHAVHQILIQAPIGENTDC